ncbi:MAG: hypothetical protein AVDCRST_MAG48-3502, partial [uncultured Friedmanniella sp.]
DRPADLPPRRCPDLRGPARTAPLRRRRRGLRRPLRRARLRPAGRRAHRRGGGGGQRRRPPIVPRRLRRHRLRLGRGGARRARRRAQRRGGAAPLPLHPLPAQGVPARARGPARAPHRRRPRRGHRAERQGHAVDALREVRGEAGPGLAPGRVLHPHPGPLAHRRLDRPGRRDRGERLPVGAARLAPAGRHLPRARAGRPALRLQQRGLRLPLHRRAVGAGGDPGGHGARLQRVPAAPLARELRRARLPPGAGQPLHERGVAAAVAPAGRGRAHGHGRLPRRRPGRRGGPVRLEGHRGPGPALLPARQGRRLRPL